MKKPEVVVIIPAFNEENSVGKVVNEIPKDWVREVIVVNNNSTDSTSENAEKAGATVLEEPRQGYGRACLKGMEYVAQLSNKPDIIVFLDADYSDYPEELPLVVQPIIDGTADIVIGSRALGDREGGSMTIPQIFGNWLATTLIRWLYKVEYTDLGPFRAIKYGKLVSLNMEDKTYGWTVEMQVKAARKGLKSKEVAVNYKKRIGHSKVSGTVKGALSAGYKIIITIFKYAWR
jgi:glycosyltransferase involved in cell wall biosynthesis